jgi:putative endonuclease
MKACVYILYSATANKYYVGCTENITIRLEQHNAGRNLSTKSGAPWELKYTEAFHSLAEARHREAAIKKKKSRIYIEWLINAAASIPASVQPKEWP